MAHEATQSASRVDVVRALRQAAITGLIAFGLLLPLIGFNTVVNIHNELILETRWPLLAIIVGVIAAGRFVHSLIIAPWLQESTVWSRPEVSIGGGRLTKWLMPFTLGFAVVYPPLALWLTGFQGAVKWI